MHYKQYTYIIHYIHYIHYIFTYTTCIYTPYWTTRVLFLVIHFLCRTCQDLWLCFSNLTSQSCVSAFGTSAKLPCLICELWLPATFCILGCSSLCGSTCTMKVSPQIAETLNLKWNWMKHGKATKYFHAKWQSHAPFWCKSFFGL